MTTISIPIIDCSRQDAGQAIDALREKLSPRGDVVSPAGRKKTLEVFGEALSPQQVVEKICRDVRSQGLAAVLDYSHRIDGADLDGESIRVPREELVVAHSDAEAELLQTVRQVRDNILEFQKAILHKSVRVDRADGVYLEQRYVPLARIGICVPGGAAAYPSTVLMTAVPAQAAGVKQLVVVAPPTKFGSYNKDLLATCHELGISEVYRLGGAQAVAALAYGVEGIEPVDKIVGPGSLFVALAKKYVYGDVDIDSIAGPSEVVIIADETTDPRFAASDLIAQAEHSPGSGVLITWHEPTLRSTLAALNEQLAGLERGELARTCLEEFGAMILCQDRQHAAELANLFAPEHLHIAIDDAAALVDSIPNAGATFLGHYSPVSVGDYVAGPSHVLPTGGTARFASGLSANDFLRSHSVIHYTRSGLASVAPDVRVLANKEGLTAHRESVEIRLC